MSVRQPQERDRRGETEVIAGLSVLAATAVLSIAVWVWARARPAADWASLAEAERALLLDAVRRHDDDVEFPASLSRTLQSYLFRSSLLVVAGAYLFGLPLAYSLLRGLSVSWHSQFTFPHLVLFLLGAALLAVFFRLFSYRLPCPHCGAELQRAQEAQPSLRCRSCGLYFYF